MISSCSDCKSICCRTGHGPYKILKPLKYLENYSLPESYNTKCEGLTKLGKCKYWGTNELPAECRSYVCQNRSFTKKELKIMDLVSDSYPCANCGTQWVLIYKTNGDWTHFCEVCGHTKHWKTINIKGNKKKEDVTPKC